MLNHPVPPPVAIRDHQSRFWLLRRDLQTNVGNLALKFSCGKATCAVPARHPASQDETIVLARHPEVQDEVIVENKAIAHDEDGVGNEVRSTDCTLFQR